VSPIGAARTSRAVSVPVSRKDTRTPHPAANAARFLQALRQKRASMALGLGRVSAPQLDNDIQPTPSPVRSGVQCRMSLISHDRATGEEKRFS
jgi:hypothetical protein